MAFRFALDKHLNYVLIRCDKGRFRDFTIAFRKQIKVSWSTNKDLMTHFPVFVSQQT